MVKALNTDIYGYTYFGTVVVLLISPRLTAPSNTRVAPISIQIL